MADTGFRIKCWWMVLGCLSFLLLACAKKTDPVPTWGFENNSIQITYTSENNLFKKREAQAQVEVLKVILRLGPHSIQEITNR